MHLPQGALVAWRKKKIDPAILRTMDLFSGKTILEEAEAIAHEEHEATARQAGPRDIVEEAEECAVRWLGLDAFHEGDDIKIAVHDKGHAVMVLVSATPHGPYGTNTIKLSRGQWRKLRSLVLEASR